MATPVYKMCTIKFLDDCSMEEVVISIGAPYPWDDDDIFFICDSVEDFNNLKNPNNGEDFYITSVND